MQRLVIRGPGGSVTCDWGAAALLRDNVMHWLEARVPSGRFPAIHALADAPAYEGRPLPTASALAEELAGALPLLRDKTPDDLASSIWTRAIMRHERRLPLVRGTILAREIEWQLPIDPPVDATLEDLFQPFLSMLHRIASPAYRESA